MTGAEIDWNQLWSSIMSSAEECIGRGYRSHPEWFEDNVEILKLLIDNKNEALQKWLQRDTRSCKCFFRQCQWAEQKAVIKAKEVWIQKAPSDAEAAVKDGKVRWNNIHRLRVYRGHIPTAIFKDNGRELLGAPNLSRDCEATCEVKCWIAKASKPFDTNCQISINTKRIVYNAVVMHFHLVVWC